MKIESAIPIKNTSNSEQYVLIDGARHSVGPYATKVVTPEIAKAFMESCHPNIVREAGVSSVGDDIPYKERVYLYNTTGNPLAPATLKVRKWSKAGNVEEEVPNPKHEPIVIKQKMGGEQKIANVGGEETALNMGGRTIVVYPYSRVAFEKHVADWMLNRDQGQSQEMRGCISHSRAPSEFEPDETWDVESLQQYAKIIDPSFRVGTEYLHIMKTKDEDKRDAKLEEEKQLMLKKLFFIIAEPKYRLPTKAEFNQVMELRQEKREAKSA